jgi:hypothetical protein
MAATSFAGSIVVFVVVVLSATTRLWKRQVLFVIVVPWPGASTGSHPTLAAIGVGFASWNGLWAGVVVVVGFRLRDADAVLAVGTEDEFASQVIADIQDAITLRTLGTDHEENS